MKKHSATLFTLLRKETLENLTSIVKETLATDYTISAPRIFSAADLWNIQKQKRVFVQRRFSL